MADHLQYPRGCRVRSSNPHEPVGILRSEGDLEAGEPLTVPDMFLDTIKRFPNRPAVRFKVHDAWREISYADYYRLSLQTAKSFVKLGLDSLSPVALMGFLSPECLFAYFGTIFAGGVFVGVCPGMTLEGVLHLLSLSKAHFVLVEKSEQVEWILKVRDKLTTLKAIIQYKGKLVHKCDGLYSWEEFIELGKDITDTEIREKIRNQHPADCVTMTFSSGTTGSFKCAMMSHDNLTWSTKMLYTALSNGLGFGTDDFLSVNAIFAISCLNLDVYLAVYCAATVHIAPISKRCVSMREYLPTIREVRPTLLFGNTNNWDDIRSILVERGVTTAESARDIIGLQNCRILLTAGASVPVELLEYFKDLGMPLTEAYGMTENSGGITINPLDATKLGSAGKPYPGTYVKIDRPDENGIGEILVIGRQRFMGYLHDEEETRKAIDDQGWLHTGDVGHIDSDGYLFIAARIKEMIVLSEGHNIAPVPIEARIKCEVPFLSNVVLVGEGREHLCCLVTLKTISDPRTGKPLDKLTTSAVAQIAQLGSLCVSASEVIQQRDRAVYSAIQGGIDAANSCVLDNLDRVINFTVLEEDFSIPGGEIGETSKLKRHIIKEKYSKQINDMYH